MLSLRKNPLVNLIVCQWGSRKTFPKVTFAEGEVVTPSELFDVPLWGTYMRVPPETCAVVNPPSGQLTLFYPGDYLSELPDGLHPIRYVDLRRHTLILPEVRAASIDAWDVCLSLLVRWRVSNPELVLDVPQPLKAITAACVAVVIDFIQSNPHDGLVCAPDSNLVPGEDIALAIRTQLSMSEACQGFEILEVSVLNRLGDRRRTDAVQQAIVEKTIIGQQRLVQKERKELDKEALTHKNELAQEREALTIKEAEIARLKVEEEEQVRLRKAEITAMEAEKLRQAKLQEIEMQNLAKQQEQEHEKVIKSMQFRAEVLGKMADAIIKEERLQNLQMAGGGMAREILVNTMHNIVAGMPTPDAYPVALPDCNSIPPSLSDLLVKEMAQIIKIRGTVCHALQPLGQDRYLVSIDYLRIRVMIECGLDYSQQGPKHIAYYADPNRKTLHPVPVKWSKGQTLQDVLFEVVNQAMNGSVTRNTPFVSGNGHHKIAREANGDGNKSTINETGGDENKRAR